jgi:5-hydroxyisourate hydrolase-like protein (transthyretin family)
MSLVLAWVPSALAAGVEVSGQVVNATAGQPVPGLKVELMRLSVDGSQQSLGAAATDSDGKFRFSQIDPAQDSIYRVSAQYKGVVYSSVDIAADALSRPVEVRVFEIASDPSVISFGRATVALMGVDRTANVLRVLEIYTVKNSSNSAYVAAPGNPMGMLRFGLPEGAMELAPQMGLRAGDILQVAQGFAVNAPIIPGDTELAFSYALPLVDTDMTFQKVIPFPTDNLRLLMKADMASAQPEGLTDAGTVNVGGEAFRMWTGSSLPPRYQLRVSLHGLPAAPRPPFENPYVRLALMLLAILALSGGVVYAWTHRSSPQAQIDRLFVELSELEALKRAKVVPEEEYRARREALRTSLKAMLAQYGYRGGRREAIGDTADSGQPA